MPRSCAVMNAITLAGAMPAKVSDKDRITLDPHEPK
jgi:hypothetical protein